MLRDELKFAHMHLNAPRARSNHYLPELYGCLIWRTTGASSGKGIPERDVISPSVGIAPRDDAAAAAVAAGAGATPAVETADVDDERREDGCCA